MNNLHKNNLDELFKDKLEGFALEPPAAVWDNISNSLANNKNKISKIWMFSRNIWLLLLFVFTITSSAIFVNYYFYNNKTSDIKQNNLLVNNKQNNIIENNLTNNSNQSIINKDDNEDDNINLNNNINKTQENLTKSNNLQIIDKIKPENKQLISKSDNIKKFNEISNTLNNEKIISKETAIYNNDYKELSNNENNYIASESHKNTSSIEIENYEKPKTDIEKATYIPPPDDYSKRQPWTFGIHVTPEIIVNPFYSDVFTTNNNKYAYSFDISCKYDFSGWFIQSGLGLLYSLDKLNYKVQYEKIEQTGSYQDIQIIGYDTVGTLITPIYQSNTVYIYDTLLSTTIVQKSHAYNYLQIPFLLGYYRSIDRAKYFVKGGIAYNHLLNRKEPEMIYFDNEAKVLDISKKTPDRAKSNWNFLFAMGVDYKLSNAITFSLEPSVRIYTSSLYDRTASGTKRSPYAIGLRYGIILTL